MTSTTLWLINCLINISVITCIIAFLGGLGAVVGTIAFMIADGDGAFTYKPAAKNTVKKLLKNSWIIVAICTIFSIVVPTKKELAVIYVLPKIANNEKIQEIPDKAIEKLLKYLEVDGEKKD